MMSAAPGVSWRSFWEMTAFSALLPFSARLTNLATCFLR